MELHRQTISLTDVPSYSANLFDLRPFNNRNWVVLALQRTESEAPEAVVLCGVDDNDSGTYSRFVTAIVTPETIRSREWWLGHYFYADQDGERLAWADFARRVAR